jgi:hypothetical protein
MKIATEQLLTIAAGEDGATREPAPARLKSRVYSALVARMAEEGPLRTLAASKAEGGHLCVFEEVVAVVPFGPGVAASNPCRICHARLLGERLERAPIFWPGCPYSDYHQG